MSKGATPAEVIATTVCHDVLRVLRHDPLIRLRVDPDGDTAVHQMRVGCRRLRSDLRTFRSPLGAEWCDQARVEVAWLADVLGAVRDLEVLRARLPRTAASIPLPLSSGTRLALMDDALARRETTARSALDTAMSSPRYVMLLDLLTDAVSRGQHIGTVHGRKIRRMVRKPWRRLTRAAELLTTDAPSADWHSTRIRAKHARYALEAVAGTVGRDARALARSVSAIQDLLGEYQDAISAARTWASLAAADPIRLGDTVDVLINQERHAARAAQAAFPAAWHEANGDTLPRWLR